MYCEYIHHKNLSLNYLNHMKEFIYLENIKRYKNANELHKLLYDFLKHFNAFFLKKEKYIHCIVYDIPLIFFIKHKNVCKTFCTRYEEIIFLYFLSCYNVINSLYQN